MQLTRHLFPPKLPVRPSSTMAAYLVGDASGSGFGSSLWVEGQDQFDAMYGGWTTELSDSSSNIREAYNLLLLLGIEEGVESGRLKPGTELFSRW